MLKSMESDHQIKSSLASHPSQISTDIKELEKFLALSNNEWQQQAEKFAAIRQRKKVKEEKFWSDDTIFPPLANRLGRMKLEEKKDDEGIKLLEQSSQQYPPSALALSMFYCKQGNLEKGLNFMRAAAQPSTMSKEKNFVYLPAVHTLSRFLLMNYNRLHQPTNKNLFLLSSDDREKIWSQAKQEKSNALLDEALEVAQRGVEVEDACSCLIAAQIMYKMGSYDPIPYLQKAVSIARAQKKDELKAEAFDLVNPPLSDVKTYDWLMDQYLKDKDYEQAIGIFKAIVDASLSNTDADLAAIIESQSLEQFRALFTDSNLKKSLRLEIQNILTMLDRASLDYHYMQARNSLYQEDWTTAINHCFDVEELLQKFHEDEDFSRIETSGVFELLQNLSEKNSYLDLLRGTLLVHRITKYNQRLSYFNANIDQVRAGVSILKNISLETEAVGKILCHAAKYFKDHNEPQEAINCLENAKKRNSSHALWLLALSDLDNKKENPDKALGALRDLYRILEYDPSVAFILVIELKELGKSIESMGFSEKKIINALKKAFNQGSLWAVNSLQEFDALPRLEELKKDTTQQGYLKRAFFYYAKKKFDQASVELSHVDFATYTQGYFLQALIDLQNHQEASKRHAMDCFLAFLKRNSDYLIVSQWNNKTTINPFLPSDIECPTDLHISINAALAQISSAAMQNDSYALTIGSDLFLDMYRRNGTVETFKLFQEYFRKLCAFYSPTDSAFVAPLLENMLATFNRDDNAVVCYAIKMLHHYPELRPLIKKDILAKTKQLLEHTEFSETKKSDLLQVFKEIEYALWFKGVYSDFKHALGKSGKVSNNFMFSPLIAPMAIANVYLQGKTTLIPARAGAQAVALLTKHVEVMEDSVALEQLIALYDKGLGEFVKKDPAKSRQLIEGLAAQGNLPAMKKLARWYRYEGRQDIKLDRQKALELMLKIFERDKEIACELGILYAEMADYEKAMHYLSPFENKINPYGLCCLAAMHCDGVGCEKSYEKFLICIEELVRVADVWDNDSRIPNSLVTIFANVKKGLDRNDCCQARINYLLAALILGASRMQGRNLICCTPLLVDSWQEYLNAAINSENLVVQAKSYLLWTWAEGQKLREKQGKEKAQRFQKAVMYLIKVARTIENITVDYQDILNHFMSEYNYLQDVYQSLDKKTAEANNRVWDMLETTVQKSKFFQEFQALQLSRRLQRFELPD